VCVRVCMSVYVRVCVRNYVQVSSSASDRGPVSACVCMYECVCVYMSMYVQMRV